MVIYSGFAFSPSIFQNLFFSAQQSGVLDFVLPGLLVFAIIFGILSSTKLFGDNKGVHIIIALVISVLALETGVLQVFLPVLTSNFAVGLVIVVLITIMVGMFIPKGHEKGWAIGMYSIGAIVFIIVLVSVFNAVFGPSWWDIWGSTILGILIVIAIIVVIAVSSGKKDDGGKQLFKFAE